LGDSQAGASPNSFHYSDVFGPLAPCGNCQKTKKGCTFDWLRSQRALTQAPATSPHAAKRRKTSSSRSSSWDGDVHPTGSTTERVAIDVENGAATRTAPLELGITFADFPSGAAWTFDSEPSDRSLAAASLSSLEIGKAIRESRKDEQVVLDDEFGSSAFLDVDLDKLQSRTEHRSPSFSSMKTTSEASAPTSEPASKEPASKVNRKKRRRRSLDAVSHSANPRPATITGSDLVMSSNNTFLTESLLKIYHNSFENALHCWLNEATCPYSTEADVALTTMVNPDWNRIYHHVFRLDRRSANVRGRQLTFAEDSASSKALNMASYAFATQWTHSSGGTDTPYPFDEAEICAPTQFENDLQINTWHEASNALQAAGDVESFRVVLAQMIFALTQKPAENRKPVRTRGPDQVMLETAQRGENVNEDTGVSECEDLLARLDLAFEADGPPMHLERGVRLLHSLRSRISMRTGTKQYHASAGQLDDTDRAAIDLLFWMGVMFDTLSAAMNKRPLVVSDEDSDIYPSTGEQNMAVGEDGAMTSDPDRTDGRWDGCLFARLEGRPHGSPVRWPCSFNQAAALLRDAAPVKVVLFRRITRIQTLVSRNARGDRVEACLTSALEVYAHWERLYSPFIRDCIQNHDRLHPRIQSWYTCLAAHWHLATLLFADLLEIVDNATLGIAEARSRRVSTSFIADFREYNCRTVADIAGRACPRDDASFSKSNEFHFALNQGSLLTEPWTVVLIRTFAKAGVLLLESNSMLPFHCANDCEDNFQRADACVRALWYLGRKSDMARKTGKILGDALKGRRKGLEEKVSDISSFLNDDMWQGFESLNAPFDDDCRI
jgi:hypothetical protein